MSASHDSSDPPDWMLKTMQGNKIHFNNSCINFYFLVYHKMKNYIPEELASLKDIDCREDLPSSEACLGSLLSLAAVQCPNLPKVWYHVGSWAFK